MDNELLSWRRKSLGILLWVVVAVRVGQFIMLQANGAFARMGASYHLGFTTLLLFLLGVAIFRDLPHPLRGWFLIGLGYVNLLAAFTASGRIEGILPLMLLTLPIHAGILLGRHAGLVTSCLSVALLCAMAWLAAGHGIPQVLGNPGAGPNPWYVMIKWLVVFLPVIFLHNRFTALLRRLATREKRQRLQLLAEARERRFLEGALLETSERERQAVGHDLHDGICQQITGAMLQCKVAEQSVILGGTFDSQALSLISRILGDSLGQVHDLARGLSPGVLTPEALVPSLRDLARRTRETHALDCDLETRDCPERLDPAAITHLYRIAQEAVINAVKHGHPGRISIRLLRGGGHLVLEVSNDGRGLPVHATDREGMGLRIMRYRTEILGGIFQLIGNGESGVSVRCEIPMARMACEAGS